MSQEVNIDVVVLGLVAVWMVGFGTAAARLARARHRSVPVWAALGAVIGPAALLLLHRAPMGRCPVCEAPVRGWSPICAWCGSDVLHVAPATRDLVAAADRAPMPRSVTPAPRPIGVPASPAPGQAVTVGPAALAVPPATSTSGGHKAAAGAMPRAAAADTKPTSTGTKRPSRRATGSTKTAATGSTKPATKRSSRAKAPLALVPDVPPPVTTTLASAVFVTGSVGLQPGSWYTLEREGDTLRVLGPVDRDARAVALTRPLAPLEASAFNGRLIVNGDDGLVMVFMRVAGMPAEAIAESIEAVGRGIASAG